jgi:hypothetical protein
MSRNNFIDIPRQPSPLKDLTSAVPVLGSDIASNLLTVDMDCSIVAFKTKKNDDPILLSKRDINPSDYFEFITKDQTKGCGLVLAAGNRIFIWFTRESTSTELSCGGSSAI